VIPFFKIHFSCNLLKNLPLPVSVFPIKFIFIKKAELISQV
jgi:hypothetical protein